RVLHRGDGAAEDGADEAGESVPEGHGGAGAGRPNVRVGGGWGRSAAARSRICPAGAVVAVADEGARGGRGGGVAEGAGDGGRVGPRGVRGVHRRQQVAGPYGGAGRFV